MGHAAGVDVGWVAGWIAIDGVFDPVFPDFTGVEDRPSLRHPGCYLGAGSPISCPGNEVFWVPIDFTVTAGDGGALATSGPVTLDIVDTAFAENDAARGGFLAAVSAHSITISNTTIDGGESAFFGRGAAVDECSDHQYCEPGQRCSFRDFSAFCEPCSSNEYSADGIDCMACPPGTGPTADYSACQSCGPTEFSTIGLCLDCSPGSVGTSTGTACAMCPMGTHRPASLSVCQPCVPGTVPDDDATACVACLEAGTVSSDGITCEACPSGARPNANRTACDPCPEGLAGVGGTCEVCPAGTSSSDSRVSCQPCSTGSVSQTGTPCTPCGPGTQPNLEQSACVSCGASGPRFFRAGLDNDGQQSCSECPARQIPNADLTGCVCKPGTFNVQVFGSVSCVHDGGRASGASDLECVDCPSCLSCELGGNTSLQAGWAFYGQGVAHRCPVESGCFGPQLQPKAVAVQTWLPEDDGFYAAVTLNSQCTTGYAGIICVSSCTDASRRWWRHLTGVWPVQGQCSLGYNHLKVGRPCDPWCVPTVSLDSR